ncbi:Uncharacterised protein [Legionella israelensis]|nr:hypothetical protein SAMN02746069_01294 [Legionella israelensis DSM 19235]STX58315.1 Uncharacterised protein [Legionella israelensis]
MDSRIIVTEPRLYNAQSSGELQKAIKDSTIYDLQEKLRRE